MREVPFNVRIPREVTAVASARWVGQGQSKPVGRGSFDFITVPYTKAALIVLLTEELARFSDPSAEVLLRNSLVRSLAQFLDEQFLSANAAVNNVSPGGILAGLPSVQSFASAGHSWEAILWDSTQAVNLLHTGLVAASRPTWIMSPANKAAISFLPNAFGVPAFPGVGAQSVLAGYPIVTSQNVPNNIVLLVDADMLIHASDPTIRLDVSREASVQADDTPGTPPTGVVSLWQQNLIGILAEKYEWWGRARDQAIVQITGVTWATAPAPISAPISPMTTAAATVAPGSGKARN
jgi:HK97 family phage major capsid protein